MWVLQDYHVASQTYRMSWQGSAEADTLWTPATAAERRLGGSADARCTEPAAALHSLQAITAERFGRGGAYLHRLHTALLGGGGGLLLSVGACSGGSPAMPYRRRWALKV